MALPFRLGGAEMPLLPMGSIEYIGDPAVMRSKPAFVRARERIAERLRMTPPEKLGDSLDMDLIENMRPEYVCVLLLNSDGSARAEREGIIDLSVRAPFSHSLGKILTQHEMAADATAKEDELELLLGPDWSAELMAALRPEEHAAALVYAYSCRHRALYKKIARGHSGILEVQERFEALEEHCRAAVERALARPA